MWMKTDSNKSTTFLNGMANMAQTLDITLCSFQEILKYQVLSNLSKLNRRAKAMIILLTVILMPASDHLLLVWLISNARWIEQSLIKNFSMENLHSTRAWLAQDQVLSILIKCEMDTTCSLTSSKKNHSYRLVDRLPEFSTVVSTKRRLVNLQMNEVLYHRRENNSRI